MVLYADESHFSERYLNRTHARAPPGERAEVTEDASRSTPYTLLAVISVGGLFAAGVKEGGYNAEEFNELISTEVVSSASSAQMQLLTLPPSDATDEPLPRPKECPHYR